MTAGSNTARPFTACIDREWDVHVDEGSGQH